MSDSKKLLSEITAGDLVCANRAWMAPLTRSRAQMPGNIPRALNAEYYAQRASSGLIISEATPVCQEGHGYYATPGIHTDEQVEGWKLVTDAVHARGGKIVCQLWHVGRVSHVAFQPGGQPPVGPTDVKSQSKTYIDHSADRVENSPCRALETDEIPGVVEQFRDGAARAKAAGFDGVEIHGANSYLLDQFTRDGVNTRTDAYGGSLSKRLRFPLEVARAVCDVWGPGRVGYRISPLSEHKDVRDSDPQTTFSTLARELGAMGLSFLHAVETWDRSEADPRIKSAVPVIAGAFKDAGGGAYIANGDIDPQLGERMLADGWADAIAFGKLFISNPDLPERLAKGGPYAEWNRETFYTGTEVGYTDYPSLAESNAGV
ncbi:MAG: alkene reductase [Planctomycetota bacterium]